jgi:hypothetical protein
MNAPDNSPGFTKHSYAANNGNHRKTRTNQKSKSRHTIQRRRTALQRSRVDPTEDEEFGPKRPGIHISTSPANSHYIGNQLPELAQRARESERGEGGYQEGFRNGPKTGRISHPSTTPKPKSHLHIFTKPNNTHHPSQEQEPLNDLVNQTTSQITTSTHSFSPENPPTHPNPNQTTLSLSLSLSLSSQPATAPSKLVSLIHSPIQTINSPTSDEVIEKGGTAGEGTHTLDWRHSI